MSQDIFIKAEIDDWGLDVYAFRILHRISRRVGKDGACFESIPNMASSCKMCRPNAESAIKALLRQNIVAKEKRDGKTNLYTLNHVSEWIRIESVPSKNLTKVKSLLGKDIDGVPSKHINQPPSKDIDDKGNTLKENQLRNIQSQILDEQFESFWKEYPRKDKKKKAKEIYYKLAKKKDFISENILHGAKLYALQVASNDSQFIALPTTWLNDERWSDEGILNSNSKNSDYRDSLPSWREA